MPANAICQLLINLQRIDPPDIRTTEAPAVRPYLMLLLVADRNFLPQLHLYQLQLRISKYGMAAANRHCHHITGPDIPYPAIHKCPAVAAGHNPHLITMPVAVIIHALAGIQRHPDSQAMIIRIQHPVTAPGLLRKHHLTGNFLHKWLDMGGTLLVRDKYPLRAGSNHHIMKPQCQHRHPQLIDDIDILTGIFQHRLPNRALLHCLGQGIPCAQILPPATKSHNLNGCFLLCHGIVETDFFQPCILMIQIMIIRKINQLMGLVQKIGQAEGKDAAVPKRPLLYVLPRRGLVRLFPEGTDGAYAVLAFRNDIAVLLAWICRLDAHQH